MTKTRTFHGLAAAVFVSALIAGCTSINPNTGQSEYDAVKTAQVKDAIQPVVSGVVRRVAKQNPDTAPFFRLAAQTFARMRDDKKFAPSYFIEAMDKAAREQGWYRSDDEWIQLAFDAKNVIIGLYEAFYDSRLSADLPEDQFLFHLADFVSNSIDQGLKDAGY